MMLCILRVQLSVFVELSCGLLCSLSLILHKVVVHCLTGILCAVVTIALGDLLAVTEVQLLGKILNAQISIIADGRLAVLASLGCDEAVPTRDNSVGDNLSLKQVIHRQACLGNR